ncbi:unnamed protein product [Prorocentrum cordatum]|uniref:Uncharacterized protein n=1 Tax=Prorocentrum cordatum TaxID=2364126 RepID=A0ABN9QK60_9DINO|nr:unnamed protein product [Polarella glacialis]
MNRVRDVLQISKEDARKRISDVSRSLYRQDLGTVVSRVDASTAEALAGASAAFGLTSQETSKMNADTYRQIASNLLEGGELPAQGAATLASAKGVLQLSDSAAEAAFVSVAAPLLQKDVEQVSQKLLTGAPSDAVAPSSELLARRAGQLGLPGAAACAATAEAFGATLRSLYDQACKEAKKKGDNEALGLMDKMLSFSKHAAARCSRSCAVRWRPGTMRERIRRCPWRQTPCRADASTGSTSSARSRGALAAPRAPGTWRACCSCPRRTTRRRAWTCASRC